MTSLEEPYLTTIPAGGFTIAGWEIDRQLDRLILGLEEDDDSHGPVSQRALPEAAGDPLFEASTSAAGAVWSGSGRGGGGTGGTSADLAAVLEDLIGGLEEDVILRGAPLIGGGGGGGRATVTVVESGESSSALEEALVQGSLASRAARQRISNSRPTSAVAQQQQHLEQQGRLGPALPDASAAGGGGGVRDSWGSASELHKVAIAAPDGGPGEGKAMGPLGDKGADSIAIDDLVDDLVGSLSDQEPRPHH